MEAGKEKLREELLLAAALGIVVFSAGGIHGSVWGRLGAAFVAPLTVILVAGGLLYLGVFLWTPLRTHKELCAERDTLKGELARNAADDDFFRRWLNLKCEAHNWDLLLGNEVRRAQNATQRPDEHFDIDAEIDRLVENRQRIRDRLQELGQPELAERFDGPLKATTTREEFRHLVQSIHQQAKVIAVGPEPPPFEGVAPPEALRMPMIFPV